jgi:hypothetical protein
MIDRNMQPSHADGKKGVDDFLEIVQENDIWCTFENNVELLIDELGNEN